MKKNFWPEIVIPAAVAVLGVVLLVLWEGTGTLLSLQARVLESRLPTTDSLPGASASGGTAPLEGKLVMGTGQPADLPGAWPRFRGVRFDNICDDGVPLAHQWPDAGPELLWSIELGEGYAAAVVLAGRVYVLDYDRESQADTLRCLSLDDGQEIWNFSYPVVIKRYHGMSRTIPEVTEKYIVTLGPKCHVSCLDPKTGKLYWMHDLVREYGAKVPLWYAGQCPMIDQNEHVILATGGDALLMSFDCVSGDVVWKSPNPRKWKMTHSSIIPMEVEGRQMYVYCGSGGVAGIATDDGSLLWQTTAWKISIATCPSPTILPDGKIFLSGGYNAGAMMLQVKKDGEKWSVEKLYKLKPRQFGSTQQTPIFYNGYIYGVRESDKQLVCLDPEGKEAWKSGSQYTFGLGPYMIAEGMIYVMDDTGLLTMVEAISSEFKLLGQAQVLDGHDAWAPMTLVAGRLILRDYTRMICLRVAK